MNRQQFNKYLSGQIYPSKHNLARICQFFKLSEAQFALDSLQFEQLISDNFDPDQSNPVSELDRVFDSLPNTIDALSRYEGFYYSHFHALGFPGSLVRSLVHIYRHRNRFYTKNIEHLWNKEKGEPNHHRFKYVGIAHDGAFISTKIDPLNQPCSEFHIVHAQPLALQEMYAVLK